MWKSPDSFSLTQLENEWLNSKDSLTKELILLSGNQFNVHVHQEFMTNNLDISFKDSEIVGKNNRFFIREVTLNGKNTPYVFARTIIPQSTFSDQSDPLLQLGNSSLGSYLFDRRLLNRENIKIALIDKENVLHQTATQATKQKDLPALWARCSTFWIDKKPLLVTETFLPFFWEVAAQQS
jgi:chorismate--pyruvate lyase